VTLRLRVLTGFLVLCVPLLGLGGWVLHARGTQSLAGFILSVVVITAILARIARTWRGFFLLQYPIQLLSAVFRGSAYPGDRREFAARFVVGLWIPA
jgi:hypothetical protein